jgi:glutathione-regulated potassium-efflux system ancillary protein KefF
MADVLVIAAHPQRQHSRVNVALMEAASRCAPQRVQVCDLYALYPDYFIDVAAEQARLREVQLLVWQHPVHWYSMPPLMKLWLDEVFSFGWAYGPGGTALRGKVLWPVLSTGGPSTSYQPDGYNRHPFNAFLPPYEQTAALCGMRMLQPLVLHGAHRVSDAQLAEHVSAYTHRLIHFPDEPDLLGSASPIGPAVPSDARPAREM